jgi:hypothetical protein
MRRSKYAPALGCSAERLFISLNIHKGEMEVGCNERVVCDSVRRNLVVQNVLQKVKCFVEKENVLQHVVSKKKPTNKMFC